MWFPFTIFFLKNIVININSSLREELISRKSCKQAKINAFYLFLIVILTTFKKSACNYFFANY